MEKNQTVKILGINAFHGDSSAAYLNKDLQAAVEEERFNRVKHWAGLPMVAVRACLNGENPDHIAISRDPRAHFGKKLARVVLRPADWGRMLSRAKNTVQVSRVGEVLKAAGIRGEMHFVEHHRAHLASAFFASPFEEAAVVSIDGFGDFSR